MADERVAAVVDGQRSQPLPAQHLAGRAVQSQAPLQLPDSLTRESARTEQVPLVHALYHDHVDDRAGAIRVGASRPSRARRAAMHFWTCSR